MTAGLKRRRAFTLLEAMVVLAMMGVVLSVATSTFVALMKNANRGRFALQAMQSTRSVTDLILEHGRRTGGVDLPSHARVLIHKSGGQRNTDVVWLLQQAAGYGTCSVVSADDDVLTLALVTINNVARCCFEAGAAAADITPLAEDLPDGEPFRRTAVLSDAAGRFLPVFLEGDPTPESCVVTMKELPGIAQVVSAERGNRPSLDGAAVVLADVRRLYIDFDAEGVRAPFGALFAQVEVDGDVDSFVGERQRLSSNAVDMRAAVGYGSTVPEEDIEDVDSDSDSEDDAAAVADDGDAAAGDDDDDDELAAGAGPLVEMADDARGWRVAPIPVDADRSMAPPVMFGIAVSTGARGEVFMPTNLPWSTRPLDIDRPVNVFPLVGRAVFRGVRP